MPNTQYTLLDEPLWPLMNKFYRAHQSSMKAVRDARLWVAKRDEIIAALCLRPVAGGHWLTGLFVDPRCREQGIAATLIAHAIKHLEEPVWLFCHPDLRGFYERRGFTFDPPLPYAMAERLSRYARSKPMIAMGLEPRAPLKRHNPCGSGLAREEAGTSDISVVRQIAFAGKPAPTVFCVGFEGRSQSSAAGSRSGNITSVNPNLLKSLMRDGYSRPIR